MYCGDLVSNFTKLENIISLFSLSSALTETAYPLSRHHQSSKSSTSQNTNNSKPTAGNDPSKIPCDPVSSTENNRIHATGHSTKTRTLRVSRRVLVHVVFGPLQRSTRVRRYHRTDTGMLAALLFTFWFSTDAGRARRTLSVRSGVLSRRDRGWPWVGGTRMVEGVQRCRKLRGGSLKRGYGGDARPGVRRGWMMGRKER